MSALREGEPMLSHGRSMSKVVGRMGWPPGTPCLYRGSRMDSSRMGRGRKKSNLGDRFNELCFGLSSSGQGVAHHDDDAAMLLLSRNESTNSREYREMSSIEVSFVRRSVSSQE